MPNSQLDMVSHIYNLSTWKVETGRSHTQGQAWLYSKTVSENKISLASISYSFIYKAIKNIYQ